MEEGAFNIASSATLIDSGNFTVVSSGASMTINGHLIVLGNFSFAGSGGLTINGTLTVLGNFSNSGGGSVTVNGNLNVTGNTTLNANLAINPGGVAKFSNNVTVNNSEYLRVGTNVAPPPYADLVIYGNLNLMNSGDALFRRNSRVAIFGNVVDNGTGGTNFTVQNGGQVYVGGNFNFTGGGNQITNANSSSPYGLYIGGSVSNTGGGSSTTSNQADEAYMNANNPSFAAWVNGYKVLDVSILSFKVIARESANLLTWKVKGDRERILIEKSYDGFSWKTILVSEYQHSYDEYLDKEAGNAYYRVVVYDNDGNIHFSKGVYVENSAERKKITCSSLVIDEIVCYPSFGGPIEMMLFDLKGNPLFHVEWENQNIIRIPVTLVPNVYFLKMNNEREIVSYKLVVQ
ncbi:MAG: hypothetical protein NZM38_02065 [Cytophagales bacterium]|nr:hypothetical protein [Cytophagales bacterium]MDW8383537.1 hypothetical protein [Flammeovirgaceae bacterium]